MKVIQSWDQGHNERTAIVIWDHDKLYVINLTHYQDDVRRLEKEKNLFVELRQLAKDMEEARCERNLQPFVLP